MQTQEVAIKPNLKVVLRSDAQQIDEVVVTAMGIKRSEKALGYAATSVGGEKIAESRTSDVMSSLAGKIAGVQISSRADLRQALKKIPQRTGPAFFRCKEVSNTAASMGAALPTKNTRSLLCGTP